MMFACKGDINENPQGDKPTQGPQVGVDQPQDMGTAFVNDAGVSVDVPDVGQVDAGQLADMATINKDAGGQVGQDAGATPPCEGGSSGECQPGVRRLTSYEVKRIMSDLLHNYPYASGRRRIFDGIISDRVMSDVHDYAELHDQVQVKSWLLTADRVSSYIAQNKTEIKHVLDECLYKEDYTARACWESAFDRGPLRLWRRPLSAAERDRLYELAKAQPTYQEAIYEVMITMLISPDFVFHLEQGELPEATEQRVRLTDHEVAARIAFATTGSYPDDALLASVEAGELSDLSQVRAHVRRLMESEPGKDKLEHFVHEWLGLDETLVPSRFIGRDEPDAVGRTQAEAGGFGEPRASGLNAEVVHFFDHVLWDRRGDFRMLMTEKQAFPTKTGSGRRDFESALQMSYETDGYATQLRDKLVPFPTKNNPGLLFRAALLTSDTMATQPIRRGVRLIERFLCRPIPSPGEDVVVARNELEPLDPVTLPNHEITHKMTAAPSCQGCHATINPAGFIFESYDIVGRKRPMEDVRDKTSLKRVAQHPLPPSPYEILIEPGMPSKFQSDVELAEALSASTVARECMLTYYFRHIHRREEEASERSIISDAATSLKPDTWLLEGFIDLIANDSIYWRRAQ